MFKLTNLNALLDEARHFQGEGDMIAMGIMSPAQSVLAKSDVISVFKKKTKDYNLHHIDIFFFILLKIYDINELRDKLPTKEVRKIRDSYSTKFSNLTDYFITLSYIVHNRDVRCRIRIPSIVTQRQFEDLSILNKMFKDAFVKATVAVTDFNPYTGEKSNKEQYFEDIEEITQLDQALIWLQDGNRIIEYDLPFGEEKILEEKSATLTNT